MLQTPLQNIKLMYNKLMTNSCNNGICPLQNIKGLFNGPGSRNGNTSAVRPVYYMQNILLSGNS